MLPAFYFFSFLLLRLGADNELPIAFRHLESLINVPDVPTENKVFCHLHMHAHTNTPTAVCFRECFSLTKRPSLTLSFPTCLNGALQCWRSQGLTRRVWESSKLLYATFQLNSMRAEPRGQTSSARPWGVCAVCVVQNRLQMTKTLKWVHCWVNYTPWRNVLWMTHGGTIFKESP